MRTRLRTLRGLQGLRTRLRRLQGLRRRLRRLRLGRRLVVRSLFSLRRRVRKLLAMVAVLRPVDLRVLLAGKTASVADSRSARVGRWYPALYL
jgi:hypothetical protein